MIDATLVAPPTRPADAAVVVSNPCAIDTLCDAFGELCEDSEGVRRLRLSMFEAFYLLHAERRLRLRQSPRRSSPC